ncbi:MAG: hypothetical protein II992_02530 [Lachnospiraceae bacterium]|nr:hypothetical protein [Lachnospiraceae bacterium]
MKRLLTMILCAYLCCTVAGCSYAKLEEQEQNKEELKEAAKELGDDIKSGMIQLDGKTYTFPMDISVFLDNGWEISNSYKNKDDYIVKPGEGVREFEIFNEKDEYMRVSVVNYTEEDKKIEECMVYSLYVQASNVDVLLPCGINKSSKPADVEEAYGEADFREEEQEAVRYQYEFVAQEKYKCMVEVNVIDNDYTIEPFEHVEYHLLDVATESGKFLGEETEGMSDNETFQAYVDSEMKACYHGEFDDYVRYLDAEETEAKEIYESYAEYYADEILYYIGINSESLDKETKKQYVAFAKKVLKKTKWEFDAVTVSSTGSGLIKMDVYPTNLFEVIEEPVGEVLMDFQEENANINSLSDKEYAAMEAKLAKKVLNVMKENLDKVKTKEAEWLALNISDYSLSEENWEDIDNKIMDLK